MTLKHWATFALLAVVGIGYLVWLDSGCGDLGGAMTWGGKVCVQDLGK